MPRAASLNEIRIALFKVVIDALRKNERVFIAPPAQDANPDLEKLIVFCSFAPGAAKREEMGGPGALAERHGIWKITISALKDTDINEIWDVADKLEAAFMPYTMDDLFVTDNEDEVMPVVCDFPYTENVGVLPDGRYGITVTVPWWAWTQN